MLIGAVLTGWRGVLTSARRGQLWYVPLLGASMALMLVRTLVIARLLDVSAFATFSGALLVSSTFCMLNCLGLLQLVQRELPVQIMRGRERAGQLLVFQAVLVAAMCAAAGLILAICGATAAGLGRVLMVIGIVHGFSQQAFLVAASESRCRGDPVRFARQNLLRSASVLILGSMVAGATRSPGWTLVTEAMLSLLLTQRMLVEGRAQSGLGAMALYSLAFRQLRHVAWSGALTLMAVTMIAFSVVNADRWVAAQLLTPVGFALYTFASIVLMIASASQSLLNTSIYPMIARRYATGGSRATYRICALVSVTVLIAGALIVWPAYEVFELAVRRGFPRYAGAEGILVPLLAVGVLRVSDFWSSFLVITKRERSLLAVNVAAALIGALAWALWSRPWSRSAIGIQDVSYLAVMLAVSVYVGIALTSALSVRGK